MLDFKRIGGEIVSSPLNENFRKLRNDISIANMNLVFPDTNGIVDTITDMKEIENPENAQACYVISSGEFYRYSKGDNDWHKIMDIGQTFRQGFLNSGCVVLEAPIKLKDESKKILEMPNMLVYFKNQPGDEKYLKGMYLIEKQEIDISQSVSGANAYSIRVDVEGNYSIMTGMPKQDNPNYIFIGTILVDGSNNIIPDFVYTLPDIPYTADRGHFFLEGGQAEGLSLAPGEGTRVTRKEGYYYDEGINFTMGQTENYPIDSDNGSNYNLKYYEPQTAPKLYYMVAQNGLSLGFDESDGIIYNKYWNGTALADVPENNYTIQQHLVTPNGQNIILYGDKTYNSLQDATSKINSTYGANVNFPYVEATRLIVGNVSNFSSNSESSVTFHSLGRLSQVGTIDPEFADNLFKLYSGNPTDTTPPSVRFVLTELQQEGFNDLYNLDILPSNVIYEYFYSTEKYNGEGDDYKPTTVTKELKTTRKYEGIDGYKLADNKNVELLRQRICDIEKEIWSTDNSQIRHEQSVRYRLFHAETRLDDHDTKLNELTDRIVFLEENKVYKGTTINGHTLGDTKGNNEAKVINLITKEIQEPEDAKEEDHWWFKHERVRQNDWVIEAHDHAGIKADSEGSAENHTKVNPHNLTTDDLEILDESDKLFVSATQLSAIENLPDDTTGRLDDIDAKHIETIPVDKILKSSATIEKVGDVKGIRFKEDGVVLSTVDNGTTLVVECKGQVDGERVMMRNDYAGRAMQDGHSKTVDDALKAHEANAIQGVTEAGNNKYYGTDTEGLAGFHSISWVSCKDMGHYGGTDITTFEPEEKSIKEEHLDADLAAKINNNYHTIIQDGVIIREDINTFEFDSSFEIKPKDSGSHTITIKGGGATGTTGATSFATLSDVDVVYTGNAGKTLVVNESGTGIELTETPSLTEYMLEKTYVDPDNVNNILRASNADNADRATIATNSEAVNGIAIGNDKTSSSLWTSDKIISNTSTQIQNEGVRTYSGTSVPSNSLGKNGDLYILVED